MKTIQITIDESLLKDVDRIVVALHTTRSAFIREALVAALRRQAIAELEHRHAQGYAEHPVEPGEFDVWESEQSWGAE
jgi:CopG family transcriptional regulator / antitoxin EndoAI